MVRFIVLLVVAAFLLGLLWPYLSRLRPARPAAAMAEPKSQKFFVMFTASVALAIVLSALMWWFGR